MKNSFVHAKLLLTENDAIVGSINFDQRSFFQQFESALYTNDLNVLNSINLDFQNTFQKSVLISTTNKNRNSVFYKIIAGIINIVSPFM
jgi:phosphatidylserine/phosphatidylglycerophosphate/cardiolipin synthase-like enzyme